MAKVYFLPFVIIHKLMFVIYQQNMFILIEVCLL